MKKNLKKVISAVLALTLAMSSFVAMTTSAATFADVADTANYAEAVNALAALGAISGYEDGTFLPDNNITRAEVTTMVVAALNMSADAQASGATTKFADVNEKAKWAAGYVNVGVANGWISGMSATEFAPSENVTYAQVLSMLTRILGYGDYAVTKGGWPDGYLAAAASAGILSGVSAAANDAMTRAQVARLIWNAVQAPMLDVTVFGVDANNSEMEKLDGDGNEFKTILSDKFDAYVFPNVEVAETAAQGALENGVVELKLLAKAPYNPEAQRLAAKGDYLSDVKVGKTDADKYPFASGKVVAKFIDDEDWELVYFAPTSKVASTTVDGSLFKAVTAGSVTRDQNGVITNETLGELQIKKSKLTSNYNSYKLAGETAVYVNGVEHIATIANTDAAEIQALLDMAAGDVVLYERADGSGKVYNKIMVTVYGLAKVTQVADKADQIKVTVPSITYPNTTLANSGTSFTVTDDEIANGEKVVTVTKNGEAADLSALAKGDIVAIKYNAKQALSAATNIEIIATTDKVTGVYNYYDSDEELYDIGGALYEAVGTMNALQLGAVYTFSLDPFGKLYTYEEEASSKNYAIVEKYTDAGLSGSSSEYDFIDVVTLDGQSKRIYVDDTDKGTAAITTAIAALLGLSDQNSNGVADELAAALTSGRYDFVANGVALQNRVISYEVRPSTGRLNAAVKETITETFMGQAATQYNAAANRLSKPLADTAVVLDASKYVTKGTNAKAADYKASALANLTESVNYEGFLVHKNANQAYAYVVLTVTGSMYGPSSDFAVAAAKASNSSKSTDEDGEEFYTLRVMKDGAGDAEILKISSEAKVFAGGAGVAYDTAVNAQNELIKKGAAFFYTVDSYGYVDRIDVVLDGGMTFEGFRKTPSFRAPSGAGVVDTNLNGWTTNFTPSGSDEQVEVFAAPVVLVSGSSVSFAANGVQTANGKDYVDTNSLVDYVVASDANIYYYDMSDASANWTAFSTGAFTGIDLKDTSVDNQGWAYLAANVACSNGIETDFSDMMQSAFVMAVDGIITNAVIFGK